MGRLGLHQHKKLLIERSPGGLYGNGSKYEPIFAEKLWRWLGKWASIFAGHQRQLVRSLVVSAVAERNRLAEFVWSFVS